MQVKYLFVTFNINCEFARSNSVEKPSERMSNFWTVRWRFGFLKPNTNRISVFRTSLV